MKNNKSLNIFIIIFIVFQLFLTTYGLKVLNATVTSKEANVMGISLYYSMIELELDSDIFRYDALACPNYECSNIVPDNDIDCTCDYTDIDPSNCPKPIHQNCLNNCSSVDLNLYCANSNNENSWITIEKDKEYIFESSKVITLRYKADPSICEGIMTQSYPIKGFHNLKMGSSPITSTQKPLSENKPQVYGVMNICPSDDDISYNSWSNNTYFITITPFENNGKNISLSFKLTSKQVPNQVVAPICTSILPTHRCISDGEAVIDSIDKAGLKFYTFQVTKSAIYTIRAPSLGQWIRVFASTTAEFPQLNGIGNNATLYSSYDEFENYITVYLNAPNILYIGIQIGYQSDFTFSITSQAYYAPVNITSLPPKAGAYGLVKSCQLDFQYSNSSSYPCDSWSACDVLTVLYPYTDSNPLNPIPSYLYKIPSFHAPSFPSLDYTDDFLSNPVKSNTLKLSVLNYYQLASNVVRVFSSINLIADSIIQFKSTFFDKNGIAIDNKVKLTKIDLPCNYDEFKVVYDAIGKAEPLLYNVTDLNQMNSFEYMLDSLTLRDAYVGCRQKAVGFFEMEVTSEEFITQSCVRDFGTNEFNSDPCCIDALKYFQCCNPKHYEGMSQIKPVRIITNNITNLCSSPSCTESVAYQFLESYKYQNMCNIENGKHDDLSISVIKVLRKCKEGSEFPPFCKANNDCVEYAGENAICDLYTQTCIPNYKFTDFKYLRCIFNEMDQVISFKLLNGPFIFNESVIEDIYNKYQKQDCITESSFLSQRLSYAWNSPNAMTQNPNSFYPSGYGLDDSFIITHDIVYDNLFNGFQRNYNWQSFDYCQAYSLCPWVYQAYRYGFANETMPSPEMEYCNTAINSFCGNCSTDDYSTFCSTFEYYQTKEVCESTNYCWIGNTVISVNSTVDACENDDTIGVCSVNCGYQCTFAYGGYSAACMVPDKNETECVLLGAPYIWDSNILVCFDISSNQQSNCGHTWVDCLVKLEDECAGPLSDSTNSMNYCTLSAIPCANKSQCEAAGSCSDSYFFNPINSQSYPFGLGKCVRGHKLYRSLVSCEYNLNGFFENDSPMGCYSNKPLVLTKNDCEAMGSEYSWWSPSKDQQQCIGEKGCKTFDIYSNMLPFSTIFNEMSEDECIGCYNSQNEYTNKFNWTPGKWTSAKLSRGKHYTPKNDTGKFWTSINKLTTTLDYQGLYKDLMLTVDSQMADIIRSSYFCRNQRSKDNLDSIACSCSDSESSVGGSCFKENAILLGQSKPCSGKPETFNFEYGYILLSNSSVNIGCGNMLVSQFSKDLFVSSEDQTFPSNFVSYPKPDNHGIFNYKNAIVGTLLSDGISIEQQQIKTIKLCFRYFGNTNEKKYPILDFGCQDQNTKILHPMDLEVFIETSNSELYICSNIGNINETVNYFPINKVGGDWRETEKTYFDHTTSGLIYTLGALFLAVSIYGFYQLVIVAIIRQKKIINRFELVHLLILMIFVFVLVRTIYFFLLGSGKLAKSAVADYILVVLPTFFYFSCFTVIVVLWYVIVVLVLRSNSASRLTGRLFSIVAVINFIIYLLLIVIILVFQYTKDTPPESCGSRIVFNVGTSKSQRIVSILYAVVQAAISLVIGIAFVYLGGSLYKAMRNANKDSKSSNSKNANSKQLKIFLLTTICSSGFILHTIFIVILVSLSKPNMAFSFAGLIITEIIPVLTILYCYDQRTSLSLDRTLSSKSSASSSNATKLTTLSDNTLSQNLSSEN